MREDESERGMDFRGKERERESREGAQRREESESRCSVLLVQQGELMERNSHKRVT